MPIERKITVVECKPIVDAENNASHTFYYYNEEGLDYRTNILDDVWSRMIGILKVDRAFNRLWYRHDANKQLIMVKDREPLYIVEFSEAVMVEFMPYTIKM